MNEIEEPTLNPQTEYNRWFKDIKDNYKKLGKIIDDNNSIDIAMNNPNFEENLKDIVKEIKIAYDQIQGPVKSMYLMDKK